MAHANVFEKLSNREQRSNKQFQSSQSKADYSAMDITTIETLKILGEQILNLREVIDQQAATIEELKNTVSNLQLAQKDLKANQELTFIDQKDLSKQLRTMKSEWHTNQFVQEKSQPKSPAIKSGFEAIQASQRANQQPNSEVESLFFPNVKSSAVLKNSEATELLKKTLDELKSKNIPKSHIKNEYTDHAEKVAKEFVFGRVPKILNLD